MYIYNFKQANEFIPTKYQSSQMSIKLIHHINSTYEIGIIII